MIEVETDGYPVVNYWIKDRPWKQPSKRSDLRRAMFALYKNCYFCNIPMTFEPPKQGESQIDTLATIDHLVSLPNRGKGSVVGKVLACHRCNEDRSKGQNPNGKRFKKVQ